MEQMEQPVQQENSVQQEQPQQEQQQQEQPKKKLDPQVNIIKISHRRRISFYVFLAKIFFKKFDEIELHALGEAIAICARVAENLKRFELGTISKIETSTEFPKEEDQQGNQRMRGKKVKMVIKMRKGEKFNDLVDVEAL